MAALCKHLGTKQKFSVAHHPQSHGQVENCIKQMDKTLWAYVSMHNRECDKHLGVAEAAIRFAPHETTGVSPFQALHGREPRLPIDNFFSTHDEHTNDGRAASKNTANALHQELHELHLITDKNIARQQAVQKEYVDKNHREVSRALDVGRLVLRHRTELPMPGTSRKLQQPWVGPYKIVDKPSKVNRVTRHVNHPDDERVMHVSQLKEWMESKQQQQQEADDGRKRQKMEEERSFRNGSQQQERSSRCDGPATQKTT